MSNTLYWTINSGDISFSENILLFSKNSNISYCDDRSYAPGSYIVSIFGRLLNDNADSVEEVGKLTINGNNNHIFTNLSLYPSQSKNIISTVITLDVFSYLTVTLAFEETEGAVEQIKITKLKGDFFTGTDLRPTDIGCLMEKSIFRRQWHGLLFFGPYRSLRFGFNRIIIYGGFSSLSSESIINFIVEIVASKGERRIYRKAITDCLSSDMLLDDVFFMDTDINDFEVRLYVGEDCFIRIDAVNIIPQVKRASKNNNVIFLQTCDEHNYKQMLDITGRTVKAYCDYHGYHYIQHIGVIRGNTAWHAAYNRILLLYKVMTYHTGWVFYLDADSFIHNYKLDVRDLLCKTNCSGIFGSSPNSNDRSQINTGVFLINLGDKFARNVIQLWYKRFMEISDGELYSCGETWNTSGTSLWEKDDQSLLQKIFSDQILNEKFSIGYLEHEWLNGVDGLFCTQITRSDKPFHERVNDIEILTSNALSMFMSYFNSYNGPSRNSLQFTDELEIIKLSISKKVYGVKRRF